MRCATTAAAPAVTAAGSASRSATGVCVPCQVNINFERTKVPPWGLHGGANGQSNYAIISRADGSPDEKVLKGTQIPLQAGDVVTFFTAGGGGYGDPKERTREAIASDLAEGLVSPDVARRDYGFAP